MIGPGNGNGQSQGRGQRRDQDFRIVSQEAVTLAKSIGLDRFQFVGLQQPQTPGADAKTNVNSSESEERTPVPARAEVHRPDQTRGLAKTTGNNVNFHSKDNAKVPQLNGIVEDADAAGKLVVHNQSYWHWEPDMVKVEWENIDVDRMIAERDREMDWLRAFEGA